MGIKDKATTEDILGVVKRTPFTTGIPDNDKLAKNTECTVINKGTVLVKTKAISFKKGEKVFVNPSTGEILPGSSLTQNKGGNNG